jgi:hypothetical protein
MSRSQTEIKKGCGGRVVGVGVREHRMGMESPCEMETYGDESVSSIEDAEP